MVYTCGKCKAQMHDDVPHVRMYHRDDGYGNEDSAGWVTVIECPVCRALFVSEDRGDGPTQVLVNWISSNPIRPLVERAKAFLWDYKWPAPQKKKNDTWKR